MSKQVIARSYKTNMRKRYNAIFAKWQNFCFLRDINAPHPAVADVINYLASLVDAGQGYSSVCTAKSAISSILALNTERLITAHLLVQRFIKGVFNNNPPTLVHGMVIAYILEGFNFQASRLVDYLSASRVNFFLEY